ncbi:MAG: hypothetical protein LQ338_005166 [Usnochroma carphineum]|nr:MAG: hypothetical protein LQ338_005166 [Usnochroma carphineum]
MEATDLVPLLEALDDDIDGLEGALAPLTKTALTDAASRLPLLDQAQLYVLVTYAIETILFSYLRLNGINAKEHAVFKELTRVKQYFEKIKNVENSGFKRGPLSLDKAAAGRILKHALNGNQQHALKTKEQQEANGQVHDQSKKRSNDVPTIDTRHLSNVGNPEDQGASPRKKRKKTSK